MRDIKEEFCYVALDPEEEKKKYGDGSSMHTTYKLPDGNSVEIKS